MAQAMELRQTLDLSDSQYMLLECALPTRLPPFDQLAAAEKESRGEMAAERGGHLAPC